MKSPVVKRSIVIAGHKTSVSLEDAFWTGLKEFAAERHVTLSDMVAVIDQDRRHGNLSSGDPSLRARPLSQPRDAAAPKASPPLPAGTRTRRCGPTRPRRSARFLEARFSSSLEGRMHRVLVRLVERDKHARGNTRITCIRGDPAATFASLRET